MVDVSLEISVIRLSQPIFLTHAFSLFCHTIPAKIKKAIIKINKIILNFRSFEEKTKNKANKSKEPKKAIIDPLTAVISNTGTPKIITAAKKPFSFGDMFFFSRKSK